MRTDSSILLKFDHLVPIKNASYVLDIMASTRKNGHDIWQAKLIARKSNMEIDIILSPAALPFRNDSLDLLLSFDYRRQGDKQSLINSGMRESVRVLRPGGHALWLRTLPRAIRCRQLFLKRSHWGRENNNSRGWGPQVNHLQTASYWVLPTAKKPALFLPIEREVISYFVENLLTFTSGLKRAMLFFSRKIIRSGWDDLLILFAPSILLVARKREAVS